MFQSSFKLLLQLHKEKSFKSDISNAYTLALVVQYIDTPVPYAQEL